MRTRYAARILRPRRGARYVGRILRPRRGARYAALVQLVRFGVVGASNTLVSFVSYAAAIGLGVRYLPAGAGAFALGAVNGFVLNRTWTFEHRGPKLRAGWRYVVVQFIGLLTTVALLRVAVHGLGVPRLEAQILAAAPVTLLCFALSRVWVFGADAPDAVAEPHPPARAARRPVRLWSDARGPAG
jgi:putative flippase GtrA